MYRDVIFALTAIRILILRCMLYRVKIKILSYTYILRLPSIMCTPKIKIFIIHARCTSAQVRNVAASIVLLYAFEWNFNMEIKVHWFTYILWRFFSNTKHTRDYTSRRVLFADHFESNLYRKSIRNRNESKM